MAMSTSSLWPVLPGVARVPGPGPQVRVRSSRGSGSRRPVGRSQVTLPLRPPGRTGPPRPPRVSPRANRAPGFAQVAPTARGLEAARLGGEGRGSRRRAARHWDRTRAPAGTGYACSTRGLLRAPCGLEKRASVIGGDRSWFGGNPESQTPELSRTGPPGKGKEAGHEVV